jgi:hypothetical protein
MPEGPEIRLAADKVAKVLVGHNIVEVGFGLARLSRFEKRLAGSVVTAVDTRGKAMLTRFDNCLTLYSHNQLYGKWFTMRRPRLPQTARQLRVSLHTETHSALLYSASDIEVLTERGLKQHPFLCRAGPDILDPELTVDGVVDRLDSATFRNRALACDQPTLVSHSRRHHTTKAGKRTQGARHELWAIPLPGVWPGGARLLRVRVNGRTPHIRKPQPVRLPGLSIELARKGTNGETGTIDVGRNRPNVLISNGGQGRISSRSELRRRSRPKGENRHPVDASQSNVVLGYWLQIRQSPFTGLC